MLRVVRRTAVVLSLLLASAGPGAAQGEARLVISADLGRDTINRHIYGHFAERAAADAQPRGR